MSARRILTIDVGNTAMKAALLENEHLLESACISSENLEALTRLIETYNPEGICYCSVSDENAALTGYLVATGLPLVRLDAETPLPIAIDYDRSTLGADRIAAAVGVADDCRATLVVDAGTALTIDVIAAKRFLGGNISPGIKLRFRSLHEHTSRLPLVTEQGEIPAFGSDTLTAIRAGVINGVAAEITDAYYIACHRHSTLRLILTGGDAETIAPLLRSRGLEPEIVPQAVALGLARIFTHALAAQPI